MARPVILQPVEVEPMEDLLPLKWVLYGPGGLFPLVRIADVRRLRIRTTKLSGRKSGLRQEYITAEQYNLLKSAFG